MANAARKARKRAVRNGDLSQQFEHEPKRPTRPYLDRQQREERRRADLAAARLQAQATAAVARAVTEGQPS